MRWPPPPGVAKAKVHFNTEHDASASVDALVSAVHSAGYEARPAPF